MANPSKSEGSTESPERLQPSDSVTSVNGRSGPSGGLGHPEPPSESRGVPDPEPEAEPAFWLEPLCSAVRSERLATAIVLVLGALLFLPRLGSMGLWDPWETHYGEVAREMIVRDDYVYPHWESAYFFSKPPLPMWLMAGGMLLFGVEQSPIGAPLGTWAEWSVRLPFAFIAIASLWAVYWVGAQLRDRATGILSALVLAGSAQFIFIGKQSMVDMPLVGFLTIGLALFCAAVFDPDAERPQGEEGEKGSTGPAPPPMALRVGAAAGVLLGTLPQFVLILRELDSLGGIAAMLGAVGLALGFAAWLYFRASKSACYLSGFYVLAGLATLAKGPAALYVLGPLVLFYILFTFDWRILLRCWLIPGGILFLLVAAPWFVVLSLFEGRDDEGKTFVARFWIHDTFNRLSRGVHGDRPTFGYYIEQLAYGMWPWSALAPFAIGLASRARKEHLGDHRRRLLTFVLLWAVWSYVAFSISKTGFHHYVFPAVPALAILIGYWLRWVADAPERRLAGVIAIPIIALFAVATRDLITDPQHLSNLFTYKYDRAYPREVRREAASFLAALAGLGAAGFLVSSAFFKRAHAMLVFGGVGVLFAAWISHYHFNMLAQHWSQAHMFKTYFEEKRGDEPIYAYQLNWRGETFYSRNTVIQVKESGANERMRALVDRPGREFIVVEQSRFQTLKNVLSPDKRERLTILDKSSIKFYLCVVD